MEWFVPCVVNSEEFYYIITYKICHAFCITRANIQFFLLDKIHYPQIWTYGIIIHYPQTWTYGIIIHYPQIWTYGIIIYKIGIACAYARAHACVCARAHTHTHTHSTRMHACTHTCMRTHTDACTRTCTPHTHHTTPHTHTLMNV